MRKKIFKTLFAFATIATISFGSYKAYGTYVVANMPEKDLVLSENIEALSNSPEYGVTCSSGYKGTCFVKGYNLVCCGEYTNYDCSFSGYMRDYCWNPC